MKGEITMIDDAAYMGQRIAIQRNAAGLSQERLANEINLSRVQLNKIENGKCMPNTKTLIKICDCLNISVSSIFPQRLKTQSESWMYFKEAVSILSKVNFTEIENM
jgi:DNA-binding XRE family transcriptional regulator